MPESGGMNTQNTSAPPQDALLDPDAAAKVLHLDTAALKRLRQKGRGPRFVRLTQKIVRYHPADLAAFVAASTITPGGSK